tara:strand:- start:358 stop:477 length:120 start_codon:yes stop_codon:yes gene_type:complete
MATVMGMGMDTDIKNTLAVSILATQDNILEKGGGISPLL